MNTKFVDTNVFIEAYFRQGKYSDNCLKLLKSGDDLFTSWLVVGEFEWVLRSVYELEKTDIIRLISSILNVQSLEISDKKLLAQALKLFENLNLDWTDCLNAALVGGLEIKNVYSYDKDFDKFLGIKRLEP